MKFDYKKVWKIDYFGVPHTDPRTAMASTQYKIRDLAESGHLSEMIPELESYLEAHPLDAETWVLLAAARYEARSPGAEQTLAKAFQIQPDLCSAWAEQGRWLMREGDWQQADQAFGQAIALGDLSGDTLTYRGMCRRKLGKHKKAKEDFAAAVSLSPGQPDAEWHMNLYQEQTKAIVSGDWVTIDTHFDSEWLISMKSLLLEQGIPTKLSPSPSASRDYIQIRMRLQVPLSHSEQAVWTIYEWAMHHHYYQFTRGESEAMSEPATPKNDMAYRLLISVGGVLVILNLLSLVALLMQ